MRTCRVTRIEGDRLTLDGNHPLAGRALRFLLRVHSVRDATAEEVRHPERLNAAPLH